MFVEFGTVLTEYFAQIWRIFQVDLPYLGLSIADLVIGCFIVSIAIRIYKSFFGIESLANNRRGVSKRYERKQRNAKNADH